jgi:aminocarboxymuconate-semialdehyde decarboxylase
MTIIDVHNHYFPPDFLAAIEKGPSNFRVTFDDEGNPVLHSPGDYNVVVPGHRDIAHRQEVLDRAGVDRQVLSFTAPGTSIEEPARAVELARLVNDRLAQVVAERGDRFSALAHLPLNAPEAAVDELDRVMDELGLPGAMLYGNASGVPLADPRFTPLWERADAHGAVLYIHPTYPLGVEAMEEFMLMPLVGFLWDTTLAAAHLVFAGVPERFPRIRWVLGHLGGAIPYLAERLDRGWEAFARCREHISQPPSTYLRRFYYDTVNFDPGALYLAIGFAGVDRVLAGSDYPHMIGSLEQMVTSIRSLDLDPGDEQKILAGNAAELLGLGNGSSE